MKRVLIVEDNEPSRRFLCMVASELGATVLEAVDGVDAINVLKHTTVDLIILDIQLPRMDGFEFLGWLRRQDRRPKVVTISSGTMAGKSMAKMAEGLGATLSFPKPVGPRHLASALSIVAA